MTPATDRMPDPSTTNQDADGSGRGAAQPATSVYPDANVFMHFRSIEEFPLGELFGTTEGITYVLVPSVIDELDSQKVKNPNPDLRERAKQVIGRLRGWRKTGVSTLPSGAALAFRVERHGKNLRELGLDESIRDDHILAEILSEQEARPGRHVLLTADFGVELRAGRFQIDVLPPPEALRLPVTDARDKELRKAKADLLRLQARQPSLTLRFPGGERVLRAVVRRPVPLTDATVSAMVEEERRRRVIPDAPAATTGAYERFQSAAFLNPLGPSRTEIASYNAGVQAYLVKYEEHLRSWWLQNEELAARTLRVDLELTNEGSASATTVRLQVEAPAGITLATEEPEGQRSPSAPERPRSPFDAIHGGLKDGVFSSLLPPTAKPNVRGPFLTTDDESAIIFTIDKALHMKPYQLRPFFLTYPTMAEIRSITLHVSVLSEELPEWVEDDLHLVVDDDSGEETLQPPVGHLDP